MCYIVFSVVCLLCLVCSGDGFFCVVSQNNEEMLNVEQVGMS